METCKKKPSYFDPSMVHYEHQEKAVESFQRLNEITNVNDLFDLRDMYEDWEIALSKAYKRYFGIIFPDRVCFFNNQLAEIDNRIVLLEQEIPEARLFDKNGPLGAIHWTTFMNLVEKHCFTPQNTDMREAEFKQWLERNLCTDWNKMDLEGESFGGYYKYPEDSDERDNAYTLTRELAIKKLCKLPFPYALIKWITMYGCNTRLESYRFVKNTCLWFDRMIKTTQILTLQRANIYEINCKH
ncbi:MAG: hypothetical protein K2Q45_03130 [Nitrosomonas sp.]|nr:hypothetical protein [Nitrosomonas sp.]